MIMRTDFKNNMEYALYLKDKIFNNQFLGLTFGDPNKYIFIQVEKLNYLLLKEYLKTLELLKTEHLNRKEEILKALKEYNISLINSIKNLNDFNINILDLEKEKGYFFNQVLNLEVIK